MCPVSEAGPCIWYASGDIYWAVSGRRAICPGAPHMTQWITVTGPCIWGHLAHPGRAECTTLRWWDQSSRGTGSGVLAQGSRSLYPAWACVRVVGWAGCSSAGAGVRPEAPLTSMVGWTGPSAHRGQSQAEHPDAEEVGQSFSPLWRKWPPSC